ncbi:unnamed protein product [Kluyveromyces dobzhanskii CBS 2104]|uniref:WGS project CCBQ000000000 data, contig 00271 n=1 Tax=Kluyveromyces dobzhanskii CBS 2104 TaxID=1427455 RepID=A0A0A8LDY4_9SACH|nr:unnamed protein product [Kluyveromyces dobzhanskii CBS 2104]
MSRKFNSIDDAVKYINNELTKKGHLQENKLKFISSTDTLDAEEQATHDKLAVNVIHKLLQRVDSLQDKLKEQDLQLRKAQDKIVQRTRIINSERNKAANTPGKEHRVAKVTKIQYREKDTKPLEAKVRKLQLKLEDQSSQLRQYADGYRPDVTWGTSLGAIVQNRAEEPQQSNDGSSIDMLSDEFHHVININSNLNKDLDSATRLISSMNKTIYTKFVLQISDAAEKRDTATSQEPGLSNAALQELARDWEDIKSQLP